jgi:MFS family permease
VSEIFPLEVRGQAISYFFVIALCAGAVAPVLYGALIGDGTDRVPLTWGYVAGGVIMIIGGAVALAIGIDAERKSLEDIADPLSKVTDESGARA